MATIRPVSISYAQQASRGYPVQFKGTAIGDPARVADGEYKGTAIGDPAAPRNAGSKQRPVDYVGAAFGDPAVVGTHEGDVYTPQARMQAPPAITGRLLNVVA